MTSLWTILLCLPLPTPNVVTKVCTTASLVLVRSLKTLIRLRSLISYSLVMEYSCSLNFISQSHILKSM